MKIQWIKDIFSICSLPFIGLFMGTVAFLYLIAGSIMLLFDKKKEIQ